MVIVCQLLGLGVCSGGNAGSLSQLMAQLKMAVRANKSKNTDVLTTAEAVTRAMQGEQREV